MFIKTVVEDYPELSRYLFTYRVPESLQSQIQFGLRVLVPFGMNNEPRLAYVIDQFDTLEGLDGNKEIFALLSNQNEFTMAHFRFLQFVSFYFFIPMATVLKVSGLFTKISKPIVHYQIQAYTKEILQKFRDPDRIEKYLVKHPLGFSPHEIRRYLGIKKSSTILPKLEKLGILKKTYLSTKIQLSDSFSPKKESEILLCNGLTFYDRLSVYDQLIRNTDGKDILFISPNNKHRDKAKDWFNKNNESSFFFGSKFSILNVTKPYDIVIIDDCNNREYKINKPIEFDLEKSAKIRTMEIRSKLVFGSFVPSVNNFREILTGDIHHINKNKDDSGYIFPLLIIRSQSKEIEKHGFSFIPFTIQYEMKRNLEKQKKSVIVMNRKGYFNLLVCKECGFTAKCSLCGIPYSYHPDQKRLICHYCGMSIPEYEKCPSCTGLGLHFAVCGTEKIEKEARRLFPKEKILRIDSNSLPSFESANPDYTIAIGTSMILDTINFEEVDFCCILGIDSLLNYPYYQAQETTFHFMASIFEKMIRKTGPAKRIIVPTYAPYAEIFRQIQSKSLKQFYETEIQNRKELSYPPFSNLLKISLESKNKEDLPPAIQRLLKILVKMETIEIISTKPLLQRSPFGVFQAEILFRCPEILNLHDQIAVMIDEFKKNEKINVLIRNME